MSNDNDKKATVDYDSLVYNTPRTVGIEIDGEKYWLPKSEVELNEHDNQVTMPEWLAKDRGLI